MPNPETAPTEADLLAPISDALAARIEAAERLLAQGDARAAARACRAAQTATIADAVALAGLLRRCGEDAGRLAEKTVSRIEAAARGAKTSGALVRAARLLALLDRPDLGEPCARRAVALDPASLRAALALSDILHRRDDPDGAAAAWEPIFAARPGDGRIRLRAATLFASYGRPDHAERMLRLAEPLCRDNRQEFRHIAAGVRGKGTGLSQADFAVELFDGFSSGYDENLAQIGNAGPEMIAAVLRELGLKRDRSLRVFDAGCGTGLCAPHLRPWARHLHGADISVGMLEEARRKKVYDLLTRSDLGVLATLPEGPFDLAACADVLVYFGDLAPVLKNLAARLRPGGWLVLTVEDAGASGRDWLLGPSGRHKHHEAYIVRALASAGFNRPKVVLRDRLRYELGDPVQGIALAAQRLALFA